MVDNEYHGYIDNTIYLRGKYNSLDHGLKQCLRNWRTYINSNICSAHNREPGNYLPKSSN